MHIMNNTKKATIAALAVAVFALVSGGLILTGGVPASAAVPTPSATSATPSTSS